MKRKERQMRNTTELILLIIIGILAIGSIVVSYYMFVRKKSSISLASHPSSIELHNNSSSIAQASPSSLPHRDVSTYYELLYRLEFTTISKRISEKESIELCRIPKDATIRDVVDNYLIYTITSKMDLSSLSSSNNKALVYLSKFIYSVGDTNLFHKREMKLPDWIDFHKPNNKIDSIQKISHQMDHIIMSLYLIQHFPTLQGRIMDSIQDHPEYQQCYDVIKPCLVGLPEIPLTNDDYEDVMYNYMRSNI